MAKARAGTAFGGLSGAMGSIVVAQTQDGLVVKDRSRVQPRRSEKQIEHGMRLGVVNRAWDALTPEECAAWRAYAATLAARSPETGGMKIPQAYGLFSGLGTKFLQMHGGATVPMLPPSGRFAGDALRIAVAGGIKEVTATADRASAAGVLTEILGQRLSGRNNLPKARDYVSLGFVTFAAGVPVSVPVGRAGPWAIAYRFVEASSGRMTDSLPAGTAIVAGCVGRRLEGPLVRAEGGLIVDDVVPARREEAVQGLGEIVGDGGLEGGG